MPAPSNEPERGQCRPNIRRNFRPRRNESQNQYPDGCDAVHPSPSSTQPPRQGKRCDYAKPFAEDEHGGGKALSVKPPPRLGNRKNGARNQSMAADPGKHAACGTLFSPRDRAEVSHRQQQETLRHNLLGCGVAESFSGINPLAGEPGRSKNSCQSRLNLVSSETPCD